MLSNKGGRGQKNREEIKAGATELVFIFLWFLFFSRLRRSFSRASHANFAGAGLDKTAILGNQNRQATQASFSMIQVSVRCRRYAVSAIHSLMGSFGMMQSQISQRALKSENDKRINCSVTKKDSLSLSSLFTQLK